MGEVRGLHKRENTRRCESLWAILKFANQNCDGFVRYSSFCLNHVFDLFRILIRILEVERVNVYYI